MPELSAMFDSGQKINTTFLLTGILFLDLLVSPECLRCKEVIFPLSTPLCVLSLYLSAS